MRKVQVNTRTTNRKMKYLSAFIAITSVLAVQLTVYAADGDATETSADKDPPSNTSKDDKTGTPPTDALKPEVISYINKKLDKLLNKNPEKSSAEQNLASVFNDERKKLADTKLNAASTEADEAKVEQAMENFQKFLTKFENIDEKLKTAMQNLESTLEDYNASIEQKYEALQLLSELKESESIRVAEKNLRKFDRYAKKHHMAATTPQTSEPSTTTIAPLANEYKGYFDEIIQILKERSLYEDPKMQLYLQQLLKNPRQLKKLANALYDFLDADDEYEDDYEDVFDFFANFFR